MGQGVHAGGSGEVRGKRMGQTGVQHRIAGNEHKVIHHIFVLLFRIDDDRCQRDFAAGSGSGGNGNQGGDLLQDPQGALQHSHGSSGAGNPCTHSFGAVHGGTAADGDQRLTVLLTVQRQCLLHILNCGIGPGFSVDNVGNIVLLQHRFQMGGNAAADNALVGDDQHPLDGFLVKNGFSIRRSCERSPVPGREVPAGRHEAQPEPCGGKDV